MSASGRSTRSRALALATAVGLGAAVVGCGGAPDPAATARTCPRLIAAPGTATIAFFRPGGGRSPKDLIVGGQITSASAHCAHEPTGVAVNAEIYFVAQRVSPAIKDATFPYFLALVDPELHVLVEEGFKLHFEFLPGEGTRRIPVEKITVHLPLHDRATAGDYAVIVGFQLTPEQLAFNRSVLAR